MLPRFSIVIPCFNEERRVGETLHVTIEYLTINAPESELIVVNDGSTDATGTIARKILSETRIATRLLENFPNRGKGAAVRTGLLAAREPIGLFSDADLSTPIEETPKLIEPIANGGVDIFRFARTRPQFDRRSSTVAARTSGPCFQSPCPCRHRPAVLGHAVRI